MKCLVFRLYYRSDVCVASLCVCQFVCMSVCMHVRASKDQILNARGFLLLDFLACNKLQILNGCTLGDIFGEYTSVNYNGRSVVDYMAATPDLKEAVLYFRILELTKYSDHKPCICDLKCTNSMIDS